MLGGGAVSTSDRPAPAPASACPVRITGSAVGGALDKGRDIKIALDTDDALPMLVMSEDVAVRLIEALHMCLAQLPPIDPEPGSGDPLPEGPMPATDVHFLASPNGLHTMLSFSGPTARRVKMRFDWTSFDRMAAAARHAAERARRLRE